MKLNKEQAIYVYRYLASVSLFGLLRDRIVAMSALRNGKIEKLSKKQRGKNMPVIQIDEKEILVTVGPKVVSPNGQIAIGRKHAGKQVKVYVVEVDEFEGKTIAMMKIPNSTGHGFHLEPYIKNPDGTVYRESDE